MGVDIERRKNATEVCIRRVRFLSTANPLIPPAGGKRRNRQPMCVPGILSVMSLARCDSDRFLDSSSDPWNFRVARKVPCAVILAGNIRTLRIAGI